MLSVSMSLLVLLQQVYSGINRSLPDGNGTGVKEANITDVDRSSMRPTTVLFVSLALGLYDLSLCSTNFETQRL
jgi:hypothetical protein